MASPPRSSPPRWRGASSTNSQSTPQNHFTVGVDDVTHNSPYFSSTANMVQRLAAAGTDALVLFNRFYQPDFDLETLEVVPRLVLSDSDDLRLPLRWVAILYGRVPLDFAITSGVHTHLDVLKGLMAGARVTMTASALLRHGPEYLGQMQEWMATHEYSSVAQICRAA